MLSGTHRYSRQEEVVYGRPAGEALTATARSLGAQRLLITTTRSLAGPGGLATKLAGVLGPLCVGIFASVKAHSPREDVVDGAGLARALGCDLLVAVGGGSVIDATKVMQLCLWGNIQRSEELDRYRADATRALALDGPQGRRPRGRAAVQSGARAVRRCPLARRARSPRSGATRDEEGPA